MPHRTHSPARQCQVRSPLPARSAFTASAKPSAALRTHEPSSRDRGGHRLGRASAAALRAPLAILRRRHRGGRHWRARGGARRPRQDRVRHVQARFFFSPAIARGSIPPRAPRAPKGRRCRGRRCPPLGTSRSPVARDGRRREDEGSERRGGWGEGGYGRGEQEKAGVGRGSSFIALAPASGVPQSPRSSRVSPSGPQRNRGSDPRRRLQQRNLWSDLPLWPQLQQLQQHPADSATAATAPRRQCNSCNSCNSCNLCERPPSLSLVSAAVCSSPQLARPLLRLQQRSR